MQGKEFRAVYEPFHPSAMIENAIPDIVALPLELDSLPGLLYPRDDVQWIWACRLEDLLVLICSSPLIQKYRAIARKSIAKES